MNEKISIIISTFNNNEIAILLLIIIALIFFKPLRTFFISAIKILYEFFVKNKVLRTMVIELIVYFCIITFFLHYIGLWNLHHFKDSILWLLFSGFVLYKDVIINKNWQETMRNYILKVISLSAAIEFVINIICLPIWTLLFLISIVCIFQMMSAYSEDKEEYKIAYDFANNTIAIIGFGILIYVGTKLINNLGVLIQKENLKAFIIPIIYTIAFCPFSLVNKIYSEYKQAYLRLTWRNDIKIPVNIKYVWKIYRFCKLDFEKLNKFLYFLTSSSYLSKTTNIDELIIEYKKQTTFLKFDSSCVGFEIDKTLNLFSTRNMQIDDYKYIEYDDGYGNYYGSKFLKMNIRSFDNIIYSAEGTNQVIQKVQISYLKNNLTPDNLSKKSDETYTNLCKLLYSYCFKNVSLNKNLLKNKFTINHGDFEIINQIEICNEQVTEYNFIICVKEPIYSNYYTNNV